MLADVQDMRCVLSVYFTCLASKTSLSPTSGLMHDPLRLCITNLSRTFSTCWWTSGFSTVYTDIIYLAICNLTASVKAVHWDSFFSYGTQWLNDSAKLGCFFSWYSDTCVCLRCWNKWVGLLFFIATAFEQTLQWTVVCSRSDATEPSYWRDCAFLGTNSWLVAMLLLLFLCGK